MIKNDVSVTVTPQSMHSLRWWSGLAAAAALNLAVPGAARADVYTFGTWIGNAVALDHFDGTGNNARLLNPTGIAVDSAGTIYVADGGDHTVRKVTAGGVVTTFAGGSGQGGSADGNGTNARFVYPFALAVDAAGTVYVTDIGNHNIRKITADGNVTTLAGSAGVSGRLDGTGTAATFSFPQGIVADAAGNVFVADTNNSTIRKITATGVVTTFAGVAGQTGTADGTGGSALFNYPFGLAVDVAGNLYVADNGSSTIRKITTGGTVSTFAGSPGLSGSADGQGTGARLDHPSAVSVDAAGNVYVIDTSNQTVRKITTGGSVSTLAGSPGLGGRADGTGAAARFFYPGGLAVTSTGTVYVADTGNHTLRTVTAAGAASTLAGATGLSGIADGFGGEALFAYPDGVAVDGAGNLFVADHNNHTIRKVSSAGQVTTFAGAAGISGSADGTGGGARFNGPTGVAVDGSGNVYVADAGNTSIRKITSAGVVSTFAGASGSAGSSDGTGSAARFNAPQGIAVDSAGNVYVADTNNSTVRKITAAGAVTTLAGVAGQTGTLDGAGGSARFNGPYAIAVDGAGNVYVADFFNATIRKITAAGTVSTLAGLAGQAGLADGTGTAAKFNQPYGVAVDGGGNVFVADTYNRAVRKITAGGSVSTLNGTNSRFYYPQGIAIDSAGNIYLADGDNQSITRGVLLTPPPSGGTVASVSVTSGGSASFSTGTALASTTYQWELSTNDGLTWAAVANNSTYSGATTTTLSIANATTAMSGSRYRAQLANPAGASTSGSATLTVTVSGTNTGTGPTGTARLINVSVRTFVGTGDNILAVGFGLTGAGSKSLVIRGVGPTLAAFGVTGVLGNPVLGLYDGASLFMTSNTGWGGGATLATAFASVGAFALPANSADSALVQTLSSGATYSIIINGANSTTGVALAEVYDADPGTPSTRLTNVSARAFSGTGVNALTAGFVIGGSGTDTLLIRAIGPGLTPFGVGGVIATPVLTLYDSNGTVIQTNAGWGGGAALVAAFSAVGAFQLPAGSADAALLVTLPNGLYTVQVSGAGNTTGVGLIEVYEMR
jgi:sugar lactone lactonase YvrE